VKIFRLLFGVFAVIGAALPLGADESATHEHAATAPENFGSVRFPVSCSAAAQKGFERAVAILHSFGYELAERSFREVSEADPTCSMAFWGVAMSRYHPIWYPPAPADLAAGREAVARARALRPSTEREHDYVEAIGAFYDDSEKLDHRSRAVRYEEAMRRFMEKYPDDREGAAFYALALLSTADPTDRTFFKQKKAATILERIYTENPSHPGAAHYIIHSFDSPALAPLALDAARSYAKIAPSAPHALHMPSHIFTRLGDWDDSIASNRASAAAAGRGPSQQLHAFDYLVYAYLQEARDKEARAVVEETRSLGDTNPRDLTAAFAFSAIPARYALERGRYEEAVKLELHPESFPWKDFPFAEGVMPFARALGQARLGHVQEARRELAKIDPILERATELSRQGYDWATQLRILRGEAEAWILQAEGRKEEALSRLRTTADLEDSTEKHPVTPGSILPARELLGDLLLEQGDAPGALREYEASLKVAPNRLHGSLGALKAARLAKDSEKAKQYEANLAKLLLRSDGERPELAPSP
jgi:hypothetical protein